MDKAVVELVEAVGAVVVGLVLIVFSKSFAKFATWYQLRRLKDKSEEHRSLRRTAGATIIRVYALIAGVVFLTLGLLLLSGVIGFKP
jgi:hypothetical protein